MERVRKALNIYTSQKGGEGNLCEKKKKRIMWKAHTQSGLKVGTCKRRKII